uniref:Uncharacterized protein n=1 Tax=Cannabis sativa TaxID=3483 RepID=A0A803PKW1_CANSA
MSEILHDLRDHGFFGFYQEILELHQVQAMSVPTSTGAKSLEKVPKNLATLEEVMKGPVAYEKFTYRSNGWEADGLHSTLTCAHQLEKIVTVAGIKPSTAGVFHRLPRERNAQP